MMVFAILVRIAISVVFLIGLGYLGWMIGDRQPPVALTLAAETPVVKQGDKLDVEVRAVTEKSCHLRYDRWLISVDSGIRADLPPLEYDAGIGEPGQPDEFVVQVDVPIDFPPGDALYRVLPSARCNVVQLAWPIREEAIDTPFQVTRLTEAEKEEAIGDALKEFVIEGVSPQQ